MSWPEALPRRNIGATTAVATIAIRSKAIWLERLAEIGPEIAADSRCLALLKAESEGILLRTLMRTRLVPKI
jgi:hypothetical protein